MLSIIWKSLLTFLFLGMIVILTVASRQANAQMVRHYSNVPYVALGATGNWCANQECLRVTGKDARTVYPTLDVALGLRNINHSQISLEVGRSFENKDVRKIDQGKQVLGRPKYTDSLSITYEFFQKDPFMTPHIGASWLHNQEHKQGWAVFAGTRIAVTNSVSMDFRIQHSQTRDTKFDETGKEFPVTRVENAIQVRFVIALF